MLRLFPALLLGALLATTSVELTSCSKDPGTRVLGVTNSQLDHSPAPAGIDAGRSGPFSGLLHASVASSPK